MIQVQKILGVVALGTVETTIVPFKLEHDFIDLVLIRL